MFFEGNIPRRNTLRLWHDH